jgi:hypothetical protein
VTSDERSSGPGRERPWWPTLRSLFSGQGSLARICVAYVVAVSLVLVVIELPKRLRELGDIAGANASLSFADREIAGGNSVLADQQLAYEARAIIPRGAPYRLVIGPKVTKQASLSTASLPGWLRYFLMPRRESNSAQWVICYGCDPAALGARYVSLWHDEYGISVGHLG